ncbi:MAG: pucL [Phycisphaerales bacterium]|nr:pucL [Phycisphaerales bacterium]
MATVLTHNSYGKSAVRLTKVVRRGRLHELFEIDAAIQLEGDFEPAYRAGDNRAVVATDTVKNTVYVLAKENDFESVEAFALILARHFPATYPQVTTATVELTRATWRRIEVDGQPHDHAFTGGGPQRRYAKAVAARGGVAPTLTGGVRDLLVLKTTASEWRDFHADRYRTLRDATDRILATKVNADWAYSALDTDFPVAAAAIDAAVLTTFATRHSLGVQQTLLEMGEAALAACPAIDSIGFELPNLHRIPFNLDPFGLKFEQDVFVATDEPYGLIKGTVSRGER